MITLVIALCVLIIGLSMTVITGMVALAILVMGALVGWIIYRLNKEHKGVY